jgi:hypothetical protein
MFEDEAFDYASTYSGSVDEDMLETYVYVIEYTSYLALLTHRQVPPM